YTLSLHDALPIWRLIGSSSLPKMLGVKRMPRPFSESRKPESRRKIAVWRGMRMRLIDSPPDLPGQPCGPRGAGLPWKTAADKVKLLVGATRSRAPGTANG